VLIVEAAHRLRGWAWIERRLFEVVGRWATDTPEPDIARWLATAAHHHAWRADLWDERVPVLHDVEAAAPPAGWAALLDGSPATTVLRLDTLAEVALPALLAEYEEALAGASEVADGPLARGLRLAIPDATEDRQSALALLAVAADDAQVADHRSSMRALLEGPTS